MPGIAQTQALLQRAYTALWEAWWMGSELMAGWVKQGSPGWRCQGRECSRERTGHLAVGTDRGKPGEVVSRTGLEDAPSKRDG